MIKKKQIIKEQFWSHFYYTNIFWRVHTHTPENDPKYFENKKKYFWIFFLLRPLEQKCMESKRYTRKKKNEKKNSNTSRTIRIKIEQKLPNVFFLLLVKTVRRICARRSWRSLPPARVCANSKEARAIILAFCSRNRLAQSVSGHF